MLNVQRAINNVTGGTVSLVREKGSWARGKWVSVPSAPQPIRASVQPVSGREYQNLPEGIRNEAQAVIYSPVALRSDDTIVDGETRYRILSIDDWLARGGYCKAVLGALKATA
ncbi:head-tail adaptor protein [Aureimonas flava]|uniref:head-tail adaptor protein n=1 Tax=Aureimonas flava TaxID=2320271 RepID=UPI0010A9699D|nr:head-tail adaptor protein [Aureimonas flava]